MLIGLVARMVYFFKQMTNEMKYANMEMMLMMNGLGFIMLVSFIGGRRFIKPKIMSGIDTMMYRHQEVDN